MYQFKKTVLSKGKSFKYKIYQQEQQLRYKDFISLLKLNEHFRSSFITILSDIPFSAYQWETPPVTKSTVEQPFEFAIYNSPGIDLPPEPGPFQQYFRGDDSDIVVFDILGADAKLIAPSPSGDLNYSHIGVFTNNAPIEQQHRLWQITGRVTEKHISDQPLWLNTAGGGVAWLHIRLDSRPKYYRHRPYMRK